MIKKLNLKNLLMFCSISFLLVSCSSKNQQLQEYNKPALYWYNKMTQQIANNDLEGADDTYTSLSSEYRKSPLISTSLLILANAHIQNEEYILTNFYLDEYIKKYTLSKEIGYIRFLKIEAKFKSFAYEFRNQQLIDDTIKNIEIFKKNYPNSEYMPLIDTMNSRLHMAKAKINKEIAALYNRLNKPKAAKMYEKKAKKSWNKIEDISNINVPFYRSIFE